MDIFLTYPPVEWLERDGFLLGLNVGGGIEGLSVPAAQHFGIRSMQMQNRTDRGEIDHHPGDIDRGGKRWGGHDGRVEFDGTGANR